MLSQDNDEMISSTFVKIPEVKRRPVRIRAYLLHKLLQKFVGWLICHRES